LKNLYSLTVLKASFKIIKPKIHWDAVHLECHRVLVATFKRLGIFKDVSDEKILSSGVSSAFFPHGLGHSLGMDVHDVPGTSKPPKNQTIPYRDHDGKGLGVVDHDSFYTYLRLRLPLQAGMVVVSGPFT
jgi:Xaa-Pro dipeptidase